MSQEPIRCYIELKGETSIVISAIERLSQVHFGQLYSCVDDVIRKTKLKNIEKWILNGTVLDLYTDIGVVSLFLEKGSWKCYIPGVSSPVRGSN